MRRIAPFALAVLAVACSDANSPTSAAGPDGLAAPPQFAIVAGSQQVISGPGIEGFPAISGDRVVWQLGAGANGIQTYHIPSSTRFTLPNSGQHQYSPDVSGDRIVWVDGRFDLADIFMIDLRTGIETPIARRSWDQFGPVISGDLIAWTERTHVGHVVMHDLATGQETWITDGTNWAGGPDISGDRMVWTQIASWPNTDIYLRDLSTGTDRQITTDPNMQDGARISGDRIVWLHRGSDFVPHIDAYDLATGITTRLTSTRQDRSPPAISGDLVVWGESVSDRPDSWHWNLVVHDLATGQQAVVTTKLPYLTRAEISGNRIVWQHVDFDETGRFTNVDIVLFELTGFVPANLGYLGEQVENYLGDGSVSRGIGEALQALLRQAAAARDRGDLVAAERTLRTFIRLVENQAGRNIDATAAQALIALAEEVIANGL